MKKRAGAISDHLIAALRDDLAARRVETGFERLRRHSALLKSLDPRQPHAAAFTGWVAQWVDAGFGHLQIARDLTRRFSADTRAALPLGEYAHLRLAEGLVAATDEGPQTAMRHFEFVLSVAGDLTDREPVAIASFWIGRCLRQEGRYDDALVYTERGRQIACEMGFAPMAAIIGLLESWLRFQSGRNAEARRILHEVLPVLEQAGDVIGVGNVHSAYGRIARREGRYERAIDHFADSIRSYAARDPRHRNVARSLINIAFGKRLIAESLAAEMDRETARRRRAGRGPARGAAREKTPPESGPPADKLRFETLRREAFAHLDQAEGIVREAGDHRGLGNVHVNRAYLFLDTGQLDLAEREATGAVALGDEKKDFILLARARIMQCMVAAAKFDEGILETQPGLSLQQAEDHAREAVEFARHTQNRRLLARAHVWHGLILARAQDLDAARECADKADALLRSEGAGVLHGWMSGWDDLRELKKRVLRSVTVDPALREWSQGLTGGKTFRRISDEFAAIVIPRIWEREGRKVSRVAATLRISPKKVRRVLAGSSKTKRGK